MPQRSGMLIAFLEDSYRKDLWRFTKDATPHYYEVMNIFSPLIKSGIESGATTKMPESE